MVIPIFYHWKVISNSRTNLHNVYKKFVNKINLVTWWCSLNFFQRQQHHVSMKLGKPSGDIVVLTVDNSRCVGVISFQIITCLNGLCSEPSAIIDTWIKSAVISTSNAVSNMFQKLHIKLWAFVLLKLGIPQSITMVMMVETYWNF